MANILVIIEAASARPGDGDRVAAAAADAPAAAAARAEERRVGQASLQALGQARRLGSQLGATVYAVLPLPKELPSGEGDLLTLCGQRGSDKVILLADDPAVTSDQTPVRGDDRREVSALLHACRQIPPVLLFFADSPVNRTVAQSLAEALGALYLPGGGAEVAIPAVADVETIPEIRLSALGLQPGGPPPSVAAATVAAPRLVLRDEAGGEVQRTPEQRCVVLTVPEGRYSLASGAEAEMLVLPGG